MMGLRKWLGLSVLALGVAVGSVLAADGDWAFQLVMGAVGGFYTLPVALALAGSGRSRRRAFLPSDPLTGEDPGRPESRMANYWRDRGHPPFMKPSDAEPDEHMFDPDRLD
jgi:hypothetical protein